MTISEKKMQIVIDNYFKSECDVNTSIRQAFEKGFRIGVKKGQSAEPERKKGEWIKQDCGGVEYTAVCSECGYGTFWSDASDFNFCPNCGVDMRGE